MLVHLIYLLLCTFCSLEELRAFICAGWEIANPSLVAFVQALGDVNPSLASSRLCFHIHYKVTECLLTTVRSH